MATTPLSDDRSAGETILMVEDDAEVRMMGEALLLEAGFTVQTAGDAAEALAMTEAGLAFDLLFTDIVMPGERDGLALATEVGRLRPGTPVLLTTGWVERARGNEHQPDRDFIAKPYRRVDLERKIRGLLDRGAAAI